MTESSVAAGYQALAEGRWAEARAVFESTLASTQDPDAGYGLASALWWLGDSATGVREAARAYVLFRRAGDIPGAVRCAVWLAITYKADFANYPAANGWLGRAERMLSGLEPGPLHGWVNLAKAYRLIDLPTAESLTRKAIDCARDGGDPDLELSALAQLGRIKIGRGEVTEGFALIDEAMAAALAGERTSLDTVVYTSCDMLSACELTNDLARAEQWCRVADDFVERFGCPFLYAECRISYGSVLAAKGRWSEAEQELAAGARATSGSAPGLHSRALTRLAALRIREGRLEDAHILLATMEADDEVETALARAALQLARGDAAAASRTLERRRPQLTAHRAHLGPALALLVEAYLDFGEQSAATRAAGDLTELADTSESPEVEASAAEARGRVSAASGDTAAAVTDLRNALASWARLNMPFESARVRLALGQVLADIADETAGDELRRALADFQRLGAGREADRVAAALRIRGIPAGPGARGVGVLSDREQQVLGLLAAGLSNPEIATRLYISRRTAAHHVSHILAKLNLRNRAEAVAYATSDQMTGSPPRSGE